MADLDILPPADGSDGGRVCADTGGALAEVPGQGQGGPQEQQQQGEGHLTSLPGGRVVVSWTRTWGYWQTCFLVQLLGCGLDHLSRLQI